MRLSLEAYVVRAAKQKQPSGCAISYYASFGSYFQRTLHTFSKTNVDTYKFRSRVYIYIYII